MSLNITIITNIQHPVNNWKQKHDELVSSIGAVRRASLKGGGKPGESPFPPPPAADTSDYVQCPYCARRFNQSAAERHIPQCKDMIHNKTGGSKPLGKKWRSKFNNHSEILSLSIQAFSFLFIPRAIN
jgi:hypothetical protein